jgi:hypothetical protein
MEYNQLIKPTQLQQYPKQKEELELSLRGKYPITKLYRAIPAYQS